MTDQSAFQTRHPGTELAGESLFERLLEAAPDAMVIVGQDGRIRFVNGQAERLFGYDRQELMGNPIEILLPAQFREDHAQYRARYFADPHARPMGVGLSLSGVRRDGREFPAEISLGPMRTGREVLVMAAIRDVTEQIAARRMLEEASRKTDFLATMSHELRTPLNAIIGYAQLLLEGIPTPLDEGSRGSVDRIRLSARLLLELIDEILTFSRVEAGREPVELGSVSIDRLTEEVLAIAEPLAAEKGIGFRIEKAEPGLTFETDGRKVRQILLNLVGNAIKFTDEGEVHIRILPAQGDLRFEIHDTGIGIPAEHQERIFEPFWQVEQDHDRRAKGSGLGLTVSRRLAHLVDGDVCVRSRPEGGSVFTLRVPRRPTVAPEA